MSEDLTTRIVITLKKNVSDPVGETLQRTLHSMGHEDIAEIRSGKFFEVTLRSDRKDQQALKKELEGICETVLIQPVMEDFEII